MIGVTSAQPHTRAEVRPCWKQRSRNSSDAQVFADAAHQGRVGVQPRSSASRSTSGDVPEGTHWFVPLQPLWRVERTFAWLGRNRRLLYDYEATVTSSEAFVHAAAVAFMLGGCTPTDKPFPQLRGLSTGSQTGCLS